MRYRFVSDTNTVDLLNLTAEEMSTLLFSLTVASQTAGSEENRKAAADFRLSIEHARGTDIFIKQEVEQPKLSLVENTTGIDHGEELFQEQLEIEQDFADHHFFD